MPIEYYRLGSQLQLNEIVMAGSHDAGITGGPGNVQTQDVGIGLQAIAGVRIFDLRIKAFRGATVNGQKTVDMKAYHGLNEETRINRNRPVAGTNVQASMKLSRMTEGILGASGESLTTMLTEAKGFVRAHPTEFLLLKFDKCDNWQAIADVCVQLLGDNGVQNSSVLPTGPRNLNVSKLENLQGKVYPLFMKKGFDELDHNTRMTSGIMPIYNLLESEGGYDAGRAGLQYWGKGGTSATSWASDQNKIQQNIDKQSTLMDKANRGYIIRRKLHNNKSIPAANPNVMGMTYWTTTGTFRNIEERNNTMWQQQQMPLLKRMWEDCIHEAILARTAGLQIPERIMSTYMKARFIPNFVMIDFADPGKCRTIFELNVHGTQLVQQHGW
jgi:hypothetical protein